MIFGHFLALKNISRELRHTIVNFEKSTSTVQTRQICSIFNSIEMTVTLIFRVCPSLGGMFEYSLAHPSMATQMEKVDILIIAFFYFFVFMGVSSKDQHVIAHDVR